MALRCDFYHLCIHLYTNGTAFLVFEIYMWEPYHIYPMFPAPKTPSSSINTYSMKANWGKKKPKWVNGFCFNWVCSLHTNAGFFWWPQDEYGVNEEFLGWQKSASALQASSLYTTLLSGSGGHVWWCSVQTQTGNVLVASHVMGGGTSFISSPTGTLLGFVPGGWPLSRRFPSITQWVVFFYCFICNSEFYHRILIPGKLNRIIFHLHDILLYFVSCLLKDSVAKKRPCLHSNPIVSFLYIPCNSVSFQVLVMVPDYYL